MNSECATIIRQPQPTVSFILHQRSRVQQVFHLIQSIPCISLSKTKVFFINSPHWSELINNLGNLSTKHTPPNQKSPQTIPTFHSNIFPNHVSLQSPPHTFLRSFYHIKEEGQPSTLTRPYHPLYLDLITFPQKDSWSKNKPHLHFVSKDALNTIKSLIISPPYF